MPFTHTSSNAIPPAQTLVAFMISVVAGARLTQTFKRAMGGTSLAGWAPQ